MRISDWSSDVCSSDPDRAPARRALSLYQAGKTDEALLLLKGARNPVAQVLGRAIRGQRRGVAESKVREDVVRYGADLLDDLRALFRPLEVIASLAPPLGDRKRVGEGRSGS